MLAAVTEYYQQLAVRGYGTTLSYDRLRHRFDVDPVRARWAVDRAAQAVADDSGKQAERSPTAMTKPPDDATMTDHLRPRVNRS